MSLSEETQQGVKKWFLEDTGDIPLQNWDPIVDGQMNASDDDTSTDPRMRILCINSKENLLS